LDREIVILVVFLFAIRVVTDVECERLHFAEKFRQSLASIDSENAEITPLKPPNRPWPKTVRQFE
jgi:hypothetical protein